MKKLLALSALSIFFLNSCKNEEVKIKKVQPERVKPKEILYKFAKSSEWLKSNTQSNNGIKIVRAINRMDEANLIKTDSILIPTDLTGDLSYYLPFPNQVSALNDIDKIILFSYATQTFAAYENGILVQVGPTNMGRKKDLTPTGLFFTNWKAEETISTFNDEWELKWNFNIENKLGVGFHQYELPGYPASHSCLRLLEWDAKILYNWADQWILENDQKVKVKGTPVIVFGTYDFDGPKPWLQLSKNPEALNISEQELNTLVTPYLTDMKATQTKRASLKSKS